MQVAFAELLDRNTLFAPVSSFQKFWGEFMMVYECCTERSWLAGQQPHLVDASGAEQHVAQVIVRDLAAAGKRRQAASGGM